jgi:hypothetical protein
MTGADRKAVKSELRAALRAKALGLPQSPQAEAAMLWIAWLKRTEGDQAAKWLLAWATGASLTVIAYHERIGERTIPEADHRQPRRDAARVLWPRIGRPRHRPPEFTDGPFLNSGVSA